MSLFVPDTADTPLSPAALAEAAQRPKPFVRPTSRDMRAQAVHRLQVGGFGLAGMLLLVALANIIMDHARENESVTAGTDAAAAASVAAAVDPKTAPKTPASDPLADIGVVPDLPAADTPVMVTLPPGKQQLPVTGEGAPAP